MLLPEKYHRSTITAFSWTVDMCKVIHLTLLILIDMECSMCLSNGKAIEEAMKERGIQELKDI